ncbi:MAG: hypothetical protein V1936_04510 [Patescibacteria group bacterium]
MQIKIQKLFVLLFVFGLLTCSVQAAANCGSQAECESLLASKEIEFKDVDVLYSNFLDCQSICENDLTKWDECELDYGEGETRGCELIAGDAKSKTGESEYTKVVAKLGSLKASVGSDVNTIKARIQSFRNFDANAGLTIEGQGHFTDISVFLGKAIDLLVKMVGVVAFVFVVIGGFRFVVAGGNDTELQKAKSMLKYAVIGLAATLLAYVIVAVVQGIVYG